MLDRYTTGLDGCRSEGLDIPYIILTVARESQYGTAIVSRQSLIRGSIFGTPILMADEKLIRMPSYVPKGLFFLLMVAGILLWIVWTVVWLIPDGKFFDLGLYAVTSLVILMGLTGFLLYSYKDKHDA
jgi:hypothetical protein